MPVLAMFYGMIIRMYFQQSEHNPPHIHVQYGEFFGIIDIQAIKFMEGNLPTRASSLALEWTTLNQDALMEIWRTQIFRQLPPLE